LFLLAAIPNPLFDVAGVAAGALRYPVWGFLVAVLVGKLVKFVAVVYACLHGVQWITRVFV
jgi:membrane protein YqaA with SNARE-associated domain